MVVRQLHAGLRSCSSPVVGPTPRTRHLLVSNHVARNTSSYPPLAPPPPLLKCRLSPLDNNTTRVSLSSGRARTHVRSRAQIHRHSFQGPGRTGIHPHTVSRSCRQHHPAVVNDISTQVENLFIFYNNSLHLFGAWKLQLRKQTEVTMYFFYDKLVLFEHRWQCSFTLLFLSRVKSSAAKVKVFFFHPRSLRWFCFGCEGCSNNKFETMLWL